MFEPRPLTLRRTKRHAEPRDEASAEISLMAVLTTTLESRVSNAQIMNPPVMIKKFSSDDKVASGTRYVRTPRVLGNAARSFERPGMHRWI